MIRFLENKPKLMLLLSIIMFSFAVFITWINSNTLKKLDASILVYVNQCFVAIKRQHGIQPEELSCKKLLNYDLTEAGIDHKIIRDQDKYVFQYVHQGNTYFVTSFSATQIFQGKYK
jgi:hypothetical protein